ncbi:hypothetical protein HNQ95_000772 [Aminobacter ciceronei]|uniref:Uncharacterized protein n=1 Tax=Aminobacter ciceronei TaxID=150723 RepID=A0ABR6C0E1_9HYPH|nr:hypothetical protein [Aminobacter ciceronei]MBA9018437.1 hypothetical protein [Aminobacter ciceronei]
MAQLILTRWLTEKGFLKTDDQHTVATGPEDPTVSS